VGAGEAREGNDHYLTTVTTGDKGCHCHGKVHGNDIGKNPQLSIQRLL